MSRAIVENVLGKRDANELWGAGYRLALPVIPTHFSLGSVLPVILYMMRWGHRRGKGKFYEVYGTDGISNERATITEQKDKGPTISQVTSKLLQQTKPFGWFDGFEGEAELAILGDLLLAYCLENKNHSMGREAQVQRVFPTHYFSSWIDLPGTVAHLRNVPEMIVAILTGGNGGGHYAVGSSFDKNLLLTLFGRGTSIEGQQDNVKVDKFDDKTPVGIDQLLAIRLAQSLGEAPLKAGGKNPGIPNQQPLAQLASYRFYEDFNVFLRAYGSHIPRQSLLSMLESCLSIGLTNIFLSTLTLLLQWSSTGKLPQKKDQAPWPVFVDCSVSTDTALRRFAEECVDDLGQRFSRLPVYMMCLRILDQRAQQERLKGLPAESPDPTARINFLGDLLFGRLDESKDIERDIRRSCNKLSDALEEVEETPAKQILDSEDIHPAWRLAEALVILMGDKVQGASFRKFLDSCLMMDQSNGIGCKRQAILKGKRVERRSIALTNTVLDFLVHRHLRKPKKGTGSTDLSLMDFIHVLRERYGFYIDEAPPGFSIPSDHLHKNRGYLERRLRDLGLFVGVNDAEAMKRLRPRFEVDNGDSY